MNEAEQKAFNEYEAARRTVQAALVGKPGARAEIEYGEAYGRMAALGMVRPLNNRYRPGVLHTV